MPKRPDRKLALLLSPLLAVAGCGVGQYSGLSANGGAFLIDSSANAVQTNGQVRFTALSQDGEPTPVTWAIAEGNNASSLGQGRIDAHGLYTPPSALARDIVQIRILATLKTTPSAQASQLITVTPGFVQSLLPQNAALTPGSAVEVAAEIAEVNGGTVQWAMNAASGSASLGVLSNESCSHSLDQYTTCKVTYTAPGSIIGRESVSLSASVNGTSVASPLRILLNADGWNSSPSSNQAAQGAAIALGSSGGNDNDYDTYEDKTGTPYIANCCGGTLGALVEDSARNQYILSNNHVLAESDQGKVGDTIEEPGLIDNGCVPLSQAGSTVRPVGTLKYIVPIASRRSNVDAALAAVAPGAVDPGGSILQLGESTKGSSGSLAAAPPLAGTGETLNAANLGTMELVKSGRTTGLTCSAVASVDLSIRINYYKDCAESEPYYTKTFTNQIGIAGDKFSDSGDSGALVMDASNAAPVGLLFSGGTDGDGTGLSVANPISDVLLELGTESGSHLTIAGSSMGHQVACIQYDTKQNDAFNKLFVPADAFARARFVAETTGQSLVHRDAGVLAVAAGKSLDSPGDAALVVYTVENKGPVSVAPTFDGLRTQIVPTDAALLARDLAPSHPAAAIGIHLSASVLAGTSAVVKEYAPQLLRDAAIFGVGVAQSLDDPSQPALLVLVDMDLTPQSEPLTVGGLRVRYMRLHPFHVTQSRYAGAHPVSSCALRGLKAVRSGRNADREEFKDATPAFPLE